MKRFTALDRDYGFTEPDVFAAVFLPVTGFLAVRVVFLRGFGVRVAERPGSPDCMSR